MIIVPAQRTVENNYRQRPLYNCCGVGEVSGFVDHPQVVDGYIALTKLPPSYTGLSIATFNQEPHNLEALQIIRDNYDIQYESDWEINKSPQAGEGGRSGVKLVVFKVKGEAPV
jgi:hypothetical protein